MLKLHSFLQRIRQTIRKAMPDLIGKHKTHVAVIGYMMITVLFILSPDYIYGASSNQNTNQTSAPEDVVEETAKEAIIRADQNNPNYSTTLHSVTTENSQTGYEKPKVLTLILAEKINNSSILSLESKNIAKEEDKADSVQVGAVAANEVDSSSTIEDKTNTGKTVEQSKNNSASETTEESSNESLTENEKKDTSNTVDEEKSKKKKVSTKEKTKAKKKGTVSKKKTESNKKKIKLSDSDIEILQRIVEAEATGENIKGKILVANVILNRVNSGKFPTSVKGVVFQKENGTYQFSPIKDKRYWSVNITKSTKTAIEKVMQGEDYSKGALYFSARSKADKNSMRWFDNNLKFLFKYGGHEFFTEK